MMVQIEEILSVVSRSSAWFWIRKKYQPSGPICPACATKITGGRALTAWGEMRRVFCSNCEKEFAPAVGTPIYNTSWQPEKLIQLIMLHQAGRTTAQIATAIKKSTSCIRDMIDRLQLVEAVGTVGESETTEQRLTSEG